MKYLFLNVREVNVVHFLRFLGYWDEFGYDKYTKYGSSVRIELIVRVERDMTEELYVQFIYDDEVLKMPWCQNNGYLCPMDDLINRASTTLNLDFDYVEQFCNGKAGINYITMKKSEAKQAPWGELCGN